MADGTLTMDIPPADEAKSGHAQGSRGRSPEGHELDRTIAELARALDRGAVRSVDLVSACLGRIEAREADIRAFSRIRPRADLLREARIADNELAAGRRRSPLHGIPFSVKETLTDKWVGSEGLRPTSRLLRRLMDSGALMLGFTRATELAAQRTAAPNAIVRNPLDPKGAIGGSSAGAAAAVAAGFCTFSVATDTGGSVRAPAAYCGVVGFKPSRGAIPLDSGLIMSDRLDHVGLLARSARNCIECFTVLASARRETVADKAGPGFRIGLDPTVIPPAMEPFVDEFLARAVRRGGRVVSVLQPPPDEIVAEYQSALRGSAPGDRLRRLERGYRRLFESIDLLVAVPVPEPMPSRSTYDADRATSAFYTRRSSSILLNLVGAPGVAVPVRLPAGDLGSVQLSAARGRDRALLGIAARLEAASPGGGVGG